MEEKKQNIQLTDDHIDDHVDKEIIECLSSVPPKNFFLFAGAGSGKTRSLIRTLEYLDQEKGNYFATHAKQIAVITYTNAACDEISRRLQYKPIFFVSTIHSFLWELIKNFQSDIKTWLKASIQANIKSLEEKIEKSQRKDTLKKTEDKIIKKRKKLEDVIKVKRFSYDPNGDNVSYGSLNHDEVIKMGSEFIESEKTMQKILITKYPILLIDESQDTKKELIDALLCVDRLHNEQFVIGMFGDTMQKIYMDGKEDLAGSIPQSWAFPKKIMNHRSGERIVTLANSIRNMVDDKKQCPRSDVLSGTVRLFVTDSNSDKEEIENQVATIMSCVADDSEWNNNTAYKSLILEHHMAASRFSFNSLFKPLNKQFSTSLRDGSIKELSVLANIISPLIQAHKEYNDFKVMEILRQHSPYLKRKLFTSQDVEPIVILNQIEEATDSLFSLWDNEKIPLCMDVLNNIQTSGLFETGDRIDDILDNSYTGEDQKITALKEALSVPFNELERYSDYVSEKTRFATHQGIKGLEFPRVMVILDDSQAKGYWFSYEKLFGAKAKTETDIKNEREGKDTSLMRTARLFYVACTRAQKSLAIVAYSANPEAVRRTALENNWFTDNEIFLYQGDGFKTTSEE